MPGGLGTPQWKHPPSLAHYVKPISILLDPFTPTSSHPMSPRAVYLIASRNAEAQRAHFAIFVPAAEQTDRGTLIQAIGAPMTGYILEFKRNHSPKEDSTEKYTMIEIGHVDSANIVDPTSGVKVSDGVPKGNIEIAASQVPTPGISDNFLAPVNDVCS
jgi:hypothetical protein